MMNITLPKIFAKFSSKIVEQFDYFGQTPQLRVLKQQKFSTLIGFMITIAIALACGIQFLLYLIDILHMNQPNVVISEQQMIATQEYVLGANNFTLALMILDLQQKPIMGLGQYFNIQVQNCKRQRIINNSTGLIEISNICITYPVTKCQYNIDFTSEIQKDYFSSQNNLGLLCIDHQFWKDNPIKIQGAAQAQTFQYLDISYSKCQNTTTSSNCKSQDEIDKILKSGLIIIHISDILAKMEQTNYPYQSIISAQYFLFSQLKSKQIITELTPINTQTDVGLISQQIVQDTNLQISSVSESTDITFDTFFAKYSIFLSQRMNIYQRSYSKVQTVLGTVGGLWQVLTLICSIMLDPFVQIISRATLAQQHFRFEDCQNKESISKNIKERVSCLNLNQLQVVEGLDCVEDEIISAQQKRKNQFEQSSKSNDSKRSLDIEDVLKFYCKQTESQIGNLYQILFGCKKSKKMQLSYATKKIMTKLDVSYILSKLQEVEKLKHVLLSEDQLNLFNYIPKPIIPQSIFEMEFDKKLQHLESKNEFKFLLEEEKTDFIKILDAFNSYQKVVQQKQQTRIDDVIINYLDEDLRNLFLQFTTSSNVMQELDDVIPDSIQESRIPIYSLKQSLSETIKNS